ncbi:MAG: hypothetical protein JJU07_10610 [Natronohydrobacter sp.]|nr:hypothetical protein [Natronohydrobacter sp.]
MKQIIAAELAFERDVAASTVLPRFRRNGTTWELLLLLAASQGTAEDGIYQTLEQVQTSYLGKPALTKFLRDCRTEGSLTFDVHEKRSSRRMSLSEEVHAEILALFSAHAKRLSQALNHPEDDISEDDTTS